MRDYGRQDPSTTSKDFPEFVNKEVIVYLQFVALAIASKK